MPTPVFVCGAECGIAAVTTTISGMTKHWSAITGTAPTVVTSGPASMRSTRCFRFNPTAATSYFTHTLAAAIASPATIVARFYVYFATLPSATTCFWYQGAFGVYFVSSDNTLRAGGATTALAASGAAVTTGVWYRVDSKIVLNTTTTVDIQVDGAAQAQYSVAGSAVSAPTLLVGFVNACTANMYIDDLVVSSTAADYPFGAGTVDGLYPRADGTHGGGWASGTFGKSTSGATAALNSNTDIWQSLDNPLVTTAAGSWVSDLTGTVTTAYVEFLSDATPADTSSVNGAMLIATLHSASTTTSNSQVFVADGSTSVALINAAAIITTIGGPVVVRNTDAYGVAWTKTTIDAVKTRFTSTDSNPDVFLDGYVWEVDCVITPAVVGQPAYVNPMPQLLAQ